MTIRSNQFRLFLRCQNEAVEAIRSGDLEGIHCSLLEIEMLGERTTWPRLRKAVADFLHLHASHVPTREVRDAFTLEALQLEVEEAIEAPGAMCAHDAWATYVNLGGIESIRLRTKDQSIREDAAALLRKYAAYAELHSFTA